MGNDDEYLTKLRPIATMRRAASRPAAVGGFLALAAYPVLHDLFIHDALSAAGADDPKQKRVAFPITSTATNSTSATSAYVIAGMPAEWTVASPEGNAVRIDLQNCERPAFIGPDDRNLVSLVKIKWPPDPRGSEGA